MRSSKIIVIGGDYHNALGIVRSLGRRGVIPDVILLGDVVDGYIEKSKYTGKVHRCQTHNDILNILDKYKCQDEKIVLITASDEIASLLDKNYETLYPYFYFPNCGQQGRLTHWLNKSVMCEQAINVGLNVPSSILYHKGEQVPSNIDFPCITKAISSIEGHKSDTIVCKDVEELIKFISSNKNLCNIIQIETFIEKDFEFQLFGLSLNGGEEIIIPGHSHIYRPGIQNEYYFQYIENDDSFKETLAKTKDFIKSVSYSGTFSVEFIRGRDGIDYFLEMNFRNDGNAICVTDAGYNLPYVWYLYNTGGDYKQELLNSTFTNVNFCPDLIYFWHMLAGELTFGEWWKTRRSSNSFTTYDKQDKKPYYYNIVNSVPNIILGAGVKILKLLKIK